MRMGVVRVVRRRVGRMWQLGAVGPGKGTEVVVETVVLLDEEHDVLDRARNRATPRLRLGLHLRRLCFWFGFRFWFCLRLRTRFFLHGTEFPLFSSHRLDILTSSIHTPCPRLPQ